MEDPIVDRITIMNSKSYVTVLFSGEARDILLRNSDKLTSNQICGQISRKFLVFGKSYSTIFKNKI